MNRLNISVSALALLVGLGDAAVAVAQQMALEEIVVTARKREESLQDVPLSITALSALDFERRSIDDLEGIADYTAGLNFEDFTTGFNGVLTIRGLTQADIQNRVQNVAVFLDGAYIPRQYSISIGLMDLARVEVVKGPQSSLYGQNAFAGAINYVSQKPSLEDYEAKGSTTVGTDGRLDFKASFGAPLVADKFAVRGSYGRSEFDGNQDNDFPNVSKDFEKIGGYENESYSAGFLATPIEGLEIDAMYMVNDTKTEPRAGYVVSGNRSQILLNCGPAIPGLGTPSFYCGELPDTASPFQSPTSNRPEGVLVADQPDTTSKTDFIRAGLSYDFGDDFSFDYIFANVDGRAESVSALPDDAVAGGFFTYQKQGGTNDFQSHEARVAYNPDGPLSGEFGYYRAKIDDEFVFALGFAVANPNLVITDPTSGTLDLTGFPIPLRNFTVDETTDAVFGNIRYSFLEDRARLSLEARQSWVDVSFFDNVANLVPQEDSFSDFTPRLTAEYDLSEDTMVYASAAKGVKAGGFNGFVAGPVNLIAAEQIFAPEENWTYEIGTKNTFLDGRLVVNASAYYIDWTNMQITAVPTGIDPNNLAPGTVAPTVFLNVGDVSSTGIEIDGQFQATEEISVNYAFSTSNPEFKDGTKWGQFVGVCDDVFCPADGEVGGKSLPRQSKTQGSFGIQYESAVSDDMDFFARTDLTYTSKQYVDALNLSWTPARYNVNASAGVSGNNWSLTAWGENLFDTTYVTNSLYIVQFRRYGPTLNDGFKAGLTLSVNY
ncbi:MAG: TonB-dependent receptor [Rhodospirillaceae bacterium]